MGYGVAFWSYRYLGEGLFGYSLIYGVFGSNEKWPSTDGELRGRSNDEKQVGACCTARGNRRFPQPFGLEKGILAVAIGWMALEEIKRAPEQEGKGLAWAGIILGALSIVLILGFLVFKGPEILQYLRHLPKLNGR